MFGAFKVAGFVCALLHCYENNFAIRLARLFIRWVFLARHHNFGNLSTTTRAGRREIASNFIVVVTLSNCALFFFIPTFRDVYQLIYFRGDPGRGAARDKKYRAASWKRKGIEKRKLDWEEKLLLPQSKSPESFAERHRLDAGEKNDELSEQSSQSNNPRCSNVKRKNSKRSDPLTSSSKTSNCEAI